MGNMTESEALQEWDGDSMAADHDAERRLFEYDKRVNEMIDRYADNKRSSVGTTIRCACCGKRILKSNYQTQFCRNKGSSNCKDAYWNNVSDKRRFRTQMFAAL